MAHRLVEVAPERARRWVDGFAERHGPPATAFDARFVTLSAPDGARAQLELPFAPAAEAPATQFGDDPIGALVERCSLAEDAFVLLVRRGGFSMGSLQSGRLALHRTGTRYVQGRTAAGGWSQQRYARRRAGQTSVLVDAAREAAAALWHQAEHASACLVVGGDRLLIAEVLADPRLLELAQLPRSPLLNVPDPRLSVLKDTARRARAIRIRVDDAPE